MTDFSLHPRLAADTVEITRLPLCRVLLMNDANHPWVILVPQRANIREIHELSDADQVQLIRESSRVSRTMAELFKADKMNVAALGNMVPQLHIHHIARFQTDAAWPAPIWGKLTAAPYAKDALNTQIDNIRQALSSPPMSV